MGIGNREERNFRLDQALQRFGFAETLEALKFTGEWPVSKRGEEVREALWKRLGAINGLRAVEELSLLSLVEAESARGAVIAGWAVTDADSAWRWINAQPENKGMAAAYTAALMREGRYLLLADQLIDEAGGKYSRHWLEKVAREWVKYEPDRVANWINGLPDGREREVVYNVYMQDWVLRSPADFADWAFDDGEPEMRAMNLMAAVKVWSAGENWVESAAWLGARAPHPDLDRAIFELSKKAYETDQAAANALSAFISDGELYDRFLEERLTQEERTVQKGVVNNLRQIASAAQQRMLDEGVREVSLEEIVGEGRHISDLRAILGENYEGITLGTDTTRITVRTPDGKIIKYDF
jgi:hypothetical protein